MVERRLIAGIHPIRVRLRQRAGAVKELFCARERDDARMRELIQLAEQHSIPVRFIDVPRLDAMAGGARHQGVVARVDPLDAPDDVHDILDRLEDRATRALLLRQMRSKSFDPHTTWNGTRLPFVNSTGLASASWLCACSRYLYARPFSLSTEMSPNRRSHGALTGKQPSTGGISRLSTASAARCPPAE